MKVDEGEDEDGGVGFPSLLEALACPRNQGPLTRKKSRNRSGKEPPAPVLSSFPRPSHSRRALPPSL